MLQRSDSPSDSPFVKLGTSFTGLTVIDTVATFDAAHRDAERAAHEGPRDSLNVNIRPEKFKAVCHVRSGPLSTPWLGPVTMASDRCRSTSVATPNGFGGSSLVATAGRSPARR